MKIPRWHRGRHRAARRFPLVATLMMSVAFAMSGYAGIALATYPNTTKPALVAATRCGERAVLAVNQTPSPYGIQYVVRPGDTWHLITRNANVAFGTHASRYYMQFVLNRNPTLQPGMRITV